MKIVVVQLLAIILLIFFIGCATDLTTVNKDYPSANDSSK